MKSQFKSELFIAIRLGPLIFSLLENVGNQWFSHWIQFKTDVSLFKIPRLLWPLTLFVYYGDSNFFTVTLLKALDNSQLCSAYVCWAQFINNKVQNSVVSSFGSLYAVSRVLGIETIDHLKGASGRKKV